MKRNMTLYISFGFVFQVRIGSVVKQEDNLIFPQPKLLSKGLFPIQKMLQVGEVNGFISFFFLQLLALSLVICNVCKLFDLECLHVLRSFRGLFS